MVLHYILLTLLSSAILFELCVFAQNNCEIPIPENSLNQDLESQFPGESGPGITVQVVNTSYNCLTHAENPTFYLYAGVSIEYTKTNELPAYFRAVYKCIGSTWTSPTFNSSTITNGSEPFLSDAYRRDNCSTCSLTAPDDYLCVPCNGSCLESSNSLEYCYGADSTECCNFVLNGTCTIACPVNFEANSSSVCVCQNQWVGALCDQCPIACVNGTQNANCTSCDCIAGFEGDLCGVDIDECDQTPCANNGTCINLVNNFTCDCANSWIGRACDVCPLQCGNGTQSQNCSICICDPGYTGEMCETDIDDCSTTPCANGGNCSDRVNNFTCSCIPFWDGMTCETCSLGCVNGTQSVNCSECLCDAGFSGQLCDVDINECQPNPCMNNGTCQDQVNNYTCNCTNQWVGRNCSDCGLTCINGAHSLDCLSCECNPGYTGSMCETDINECMPDPCMNNATCQDQVNNYTCNCTNEWMGRNCSECSLTCINGVQRPDCSSCECTVGFNGSMCEVNIDDCETNPCINGGVCQDLVNNFSCNCINFWIGGTCNVCTLNCTFGMQESDCSMCNCSKGFAGTESCSDVNECAAQIQPCPANANCNNTFGGFECSCINSFIGSQCDQCPLACGNGTYSPDCSTCICDPGYTGIICNTDTNECIPDPCLNNGTCQDRVNNYTCTCTNQWSGRNCSDCLLDCNNGVSSDSCSMCVCDSQYTGDSCDVILNPCEPNPCRHEGECVANGTAYECTCLSGYIGEDCGVGVYTCNNSDTCNLGACVEATVPEEIEGVPPSYCVCPPSYVGEVCDELISGCVPGACQNGGRCDIGKNELYNLNFTCACRDPFSGPNCQICPLDSLCENGITSADCSRCICELPYTGTYCSESSCPQGQVIDANECKDACTTNNYQPSAVNKDICSACGIDHCVRCDKKGGICTECQVGYKAGKKECVRSLLGCGIENCERCYAGICTVCVGNYSLTLDNRCQQIFRRGDTSANTNNHLHIILGSVAGVALLCIILVAILIGTGVGVVYYKKFKKDSAALETTKNVEIEFSNPLYLSTETSSKEDLMKSL